MLVRDGARHWRARRLHLAAQAGALAAGAELAQEIPGEDAVLVAVAPVEADGVAAHALGGGSLGRRSKHGQGAGCWLGTLAGFAVLLDALVVAQGAGTGIAQVLKRVRTLVAVHPLDVHAGALFQVNLHRLR